MANNIATRTVTDTVLVAGNKQVATQQTAKALFQGFGEYIAASLPQHVPQELLLNAMLNSIRKNPKLLNCTQASMLSAIMFSAQTGLLPDTPAQECHLIPYGSTCQWIPGFRGYQKLARQSGEVLDIVARVVYKGDEFKQVLGSSEEILHVPSDDPAVDDKGKPIPTHFYAIAFLSNGRSKFEVMTKAQVDKVRDGSRAKDDGPWVQWYEEMGRKTVFRRLAKWLPMSASMAAAIEMDNRATMGDNQPLHPQLAGVVEELTEQDTGESRTEELKNRLKKKTDSPSPDPSAEGEGSGSSDSPDPKRAAIIRFEAFIASTWDDDRQRGLLLNDAVDTGIIPCLDLEKGDVTIDHVNALIEFAEQKAKVQ